MAESSLDKLLRLAKEKKAAASVASTQPVPDVVITQEEIANDPNRSVEKGTDLQPVSGSGDSTVAQTDVSVETGIAIIPGQSDPVTTDISTHPLAMQFAELEAALLQKDPEFKTILRQIHRHLGNEPELVTMMSEDEIQMIVSGLVIFANAEIVAPAVAKTAKSAMAAAKKKVISADDL